ncbi:hypothetical protein BO71DRAFT_43508 [Aspergillus ellipticus CBS 707.79]|uniref:Uncharacterized protein n=1 Tax=Aspergillus ellipticus CBS 707.79 TaxID=1448320 RepID=A0A319DU86_9EURO|nr:hypothetical protein BO71DRAFT_43508 [Aspergillus ellipticus CBS 707.79]
MVMDCHGCAHDPWTSADCCFHHLRGHAALRRFIGARHPQGKVARERQTGGANRKGREERGGGQTRSVCVCVCVCVRAHVDDDEPNKGQARKLNSAIPSPGPQLPAPGMYYSPRHCSPLQSPDSVRILATSTVWGCSDREISMRRFATRCGESRCIYYYSRLIGRGVSRLTTLFAGLLGVDRMGPVIRIKKDTVSATLASQRSHLIAPKQGRRGIVYACNYVPFGLLFPRFPCFSALYGADRREISTSTYLRK